MRLKPRSAAALYNRGTAYLSNRNYAEAVADFTASIALAPNLALAFMNRGIAYSSQDLLDQALLDLNEAVRLDSTNADALFNRGLVFHKKGNYERAIQDQTSVLIIDQQHADAYTARGAARHRSGNTVEAIADFSVKRLGRIDQDRRRRVDHPLGAVSVHLSSIGPDIDEMTSEPVCSQLRAFNLLSGLVRVNDGDQRIFEIVDDECRSLHRFPWTVV